MRNVKITTACGYRLVVGCLCLVMLAASAIANERKPNIVYMLADDLGYGDLGCYGQQQIKTPHIDQLAAEGIRFTDHYSGAPVCAPARCVLLTGLHTGHCPIRNNKALKQEGNVPIPQSYLTLGEVMKKAGYATGAFGKWGQGFPGSEGDPVKRGFDLFYGYNCQREAHNYYPDHLWRNTERVLLSGNQGQQEREYSHDLIVDEALAFIRKHHDRPFFVYLPFTIPHTKFQVPELGDYGSNDWQKNHQIQAAMISRMDRDVGRLMALLKELQQDQNTLVIFTSDNGPHGSSGTLQKFQAAGPLRGKKGATYEGGIRVPFVARWPGNIAPGTVSDHPSGFQDMLPTFAELAGGQVPKNLDGISVVPTLLGKGDQRQHDYLYWELGTKQGLRKGQWKVVRNNTRTQLGPIELYDLATDIGETTDLADRRPQIAAELARLMQQARHPSPLFPNQVLDR